MVELSEITEQPKKLTVEEFELNKFKEQKRQDGIKKELGKFRKQDSIFNTPKHMDIFREGATIFDGKDGKKKKKPKGNGKILTGGSLLSTRGNLFGR